MSRDIVQFVPFKDFRYDHVKLAKEVLQELPGQVVDYFMTRDITPMPAKAEQREALQKKLSLSRAQDPDALLDAHIEGKKHMMCETLAQNGYDYN